MQVDNMNDMLDMFVDLSCDSFLWLVSKRPVHVIGCLPGCDTCALTTQEPYFKVIYFRYRNFEVYIWKVRQSSQNSHYSCTCRFLSAMCSKLLKQFSTKFSACTLQHCIETLSVLFLNLLWLWFLYPVDRVFVVPALHFKDCHCCPASVHLIFACSCMSFVKMCIVSV